MKKIVFAILSLMGCVELSAQSITVQEYIAAYKDIAISEMKRVGIPASITLAQGILETENGNSDLVRRSNNHFGIKCKSNWTGASVSHDDDERGECFRKYDNAAESYRDHSDFLKNSSRYAPLFILDPADYRGWAYGLKKAGYATNPRYPEILIRNIEQNNLRQYDDPTTGQEQTQFADKKFIDTNNEEVVTTIKSQEPVEQEIDKNTASIKAGKTLFNGLKAVFVSKGTSLLAVATEFDISLSKLMEYNDLKNDGILKQEQWIFLEKKLKTGKAPFHLAGQGETLYSIAQVYAIQLETLLQCNAPIKEDEIIRKGTKIWLKPGLGKTSSEQAPLNTVIHEVQPREGLYSISIKYHVPVEEIKRLNSLSVDQLQVGQQLIISK